LHIKYILPSRDFNLNRESAAPGFFARVEPGDRGAVVTGSEEVVVEAVVVEGVVEVEVVEEGEEAAGLDDNGEAGKVLVEGEGGEMNELLEGEGGEMNELLEGEEGGENFGRLPGGAEASLADEKVFGEGGG
jgi:hypothetical protein